MKRHVSFQEPTVLHLWEDDDESVDVEEDEDFFFEIDDDEICPSECNVPQDVSVVSCPCQEPLVTCKRRDVEILFPQFLPCKCGKHAMLLDQQQDHGSDENSVCTFNTFSSEAHEDSGVSLDKVLRPWQVEFLRSYKITTIKKFVKMYKYRTEDLVRVMKKWCKKEKGLVIKTKKCRVALHIWTTTCASTAKLVKRNARKFSARAAPPIYSKDTSDCSSVASANPLKHQILQMYSKKDKPAKTTTRPPPPCEQFVHRNPFDYDTSIL